MDKDLFEVLSRKFGARKCTTHSDGHFEIETTHQLPVELATISVAFEVHADSASSYNYGFHSIVSYRYTYRFLPTAKPQLEFMFSKELERLKYKEFSESFDLEVQSELEQRKD